MPNMPTERNLFNADHGAGKGDKERSSSWRNNYDSIDWGVVAADGFVAEGAKQVKRYGTSQPVRPSCDPHIYCAACKGWLLLPHEEYERQMSEPTNGWFCPACGAIATDFAYRST